MTYTQTVQLAAATTTLALLTAIGCASNEITTPAVLAPEPQESLVFADTTQPVRDFPQSTSYIQNGDTVGGSTGFRYRSYDNISVGAAPLVEPGVFALNVVTLPYTLIEQRGERTSTGLQFPPTHTAMPPLPQGPVYATPTPAGEAPATPEDSASPMTPTTLPVTENQTLGTAAPTDVLARAAGESGPSFTIVGQVQRPGMYDTRDLKLSQIITAAGPATGDASKVRIQLDRPGEESDSTTLDQLLTGAIDDIAVKAGDVITVSVLP